MSTWGVGHHIGKTWNHHVIHRCPQCDTSTMWYLKTTMWYLKTAMWYLNVIWYHIEVSHCGNLRYIFVSHGGSISITFMYPIGISHQELSHWGITLTNYIIDVSHWLNFGQKVSHGDITLTLITSGYLMVIFNIKVLYLISYISSAYVMVWANIKLGYHIEMYLTWYHIEVSHRVYPIKLSHGLSNYIMVMWHIKLRYHIGKYLISVCHGVRKYQIEVSHWHVSHGVSHWCIP